MRKVDLVCQAPQTTFAHFQHGHFFTEIYLDLALHFLWIVLEDDTIKRAFMVVSPHPCLFNPWYMTGMIFFSQSLTFLFLMA